MNSILTATRVHEVFRACLFHDGEDTSTRVKVECITQSFGFHPERLEEQRPVIEEMLAELPDEFQKNGGGGWSFLNACMDKHGNHWAEHPTMQLLVALGLGIGRVHFSLPREMWSVFPGGMPYFVIG